ncbi:Rpn family recombination-promoting nuclease/putative transposase [Klebsiella quasivariicola]|nr:Rpn family recombination-promoting nuclease/putative transposase [Klebsiella quasivariicola]
MPDEEIAYRRNRAALKLIRKHIHQPDLAKLIVRLVPILLAGYLFSSRLNPSPEL